ncbi:hypothetical protein [Longimicrobium sp.]|uniref:hypothetical protein n=1 Tax=Longimicrobium sp. TaxID=2029185 RepID=UPI002E344DC1|nr:hypothetical protein [Longimicrobium sp.]HEX6039994.1 hypothetical protein [Longimicrobium sp.]
MRRTFGIAAAVAALAVLAAVRLRAQQEWTPPSRDMPQMPASTELSGGWRGSLGAWFRGMDLSAVRAQGEGGGARPRMIRFMGGRPVASWTDRNGDGRADLVEVYRDGAPAFQLIDADYDGTANVLRVYDASGALARETRF